MLYTIINGEKVFLTPEVSKEFEKEINRERYRARRDRACGQSDFRRCLGDCGTCPWHVQGRIVSTDDPEYTEGPVRRAEGGAIRHSDCANGASAEQTALDRITLESIFDYAARAERNGAEILRRHFELPDDPLSGRRIAEELGMAPSTVNDILRRLLTYIRAHREEFLG